METYSNLFEFFRVYTIKIEKVIIHSLFLKKKSIFAKKD